jgi:hypothetical protein
MNGRGVSCYDCTLLTVHTYKQNTYSIDASADSFINVKPSKDGIPANSVCLFPVLKFQSCYLTKLSSAKFT